MTTKNSSPRSIEWNRKYASTHGGDIHVFNIEMEDGSTGIFTTTKQDQTKFKVGQSVDYTYEELKDKKGNTYVKIDKVSTQVSGGKGGYQGGGKSPEVQRSIVASVCLDCAVILIESRGLTDSIEPDLKGVTSLADKFYNHIMDKSGTDTQMSINYQSRLKLVVNNLIKFKKLDIASSNSVLAYTDQLVEYLQMKSK